MGKVQGCPECAGDSSGGPSPTECRGMLLRCPTRNETRCVLFDTLFGTNSAPILLIDPDSDGAIVEVNSKACEFYGYSRDVFRQLHVWDINALGRSVLTVMREISSWDGGHHPQRFRHRMADGTTRDVQVYAGPIDLADQRLLLCIVEDITAVIEAEQFSRLLLESVNLGVCGTDTAGNFTFVNTEAVRAFGFQHASEIIKLGVERFLGAAGCAEAGEARQIMEAISTGKPLNAFECWLRRGNGVAFPVRLVVSPIRVGDVVNGAVLSFSDLTRQREREDQVSDLINALPGVVFQTVMSPSGQFGTPYFNEAAAGFLGIPKGGDLGTAGVLSGFLTPEDWVGLLGSLRRAARHLKSWEREFQIKRPEGGKWLLGRARTRRRSDGSVVLNGVLLDITDRKGLERRLEEAALTDSLTDLRNRRFFEQAMKDAAASQLRTGAAYSLAIFDIDYFKQLNDGYGHDAGDDTLRRVARVLKERSRATDCVARWGGEEFALLMPQTTSDLAAAIADDIRCRVADGDGIRVSVSVGVGEIRPGEELNAFFRRVDAALYRAKAAGRNRVETAGLAEADERASA